MDDIRCEWIRNKVNLALEIDDIDVFDELLNRDDGVCERNIAKFLNETADTEGEATLIFYKEMFEEVEEFEVECGK